MYSLLIFNLYSFRKVKGLYIRVKPVKIFVIKFFKPDTRKRDIYVCMNILAYTVYREEIEHLNIDATEV